MKAGNLQIDPPPNLPYLLELVGENPGANNQCPFLLPIAIIQKLKTALCQEYPIPALARLVSRVRERTPAAFTGDNRLFSRWTSGNQEASATIGRKC